MCAENYPRSKVASLLCPQRTCLPCSLPLARKVRLTCKDLTIATDSSSSLEPPIQHAANHPPQLWPRAHSINRLLDRVHQHQALDRQVPGLNPETAMKPVQPVCQVAGPFNREKTTKRGHCLGKDQQLSAELVHLSEVLAPWLPRNMAPQLLTAQAHIK